MRTIANLISVLGPQARIIGGAADPDKEITAITADSRAVEPGGAFFAVAGTAVDGHTYIPAACRAGAAVVVGSHIDADAAADYPEVLMVNVDDVPRALGAVASWWYGYPSRRLRLVGVTGTNGKTTIATLLYDMMRLRDERAGLLSTVVNRIDEREVPATHTTPDVITIHRLLSEMVAAGCTFCAMEVSSHAADQQRIAGLEFDGAVFTNLTRDHLDYHHTFRNYLEAKKKFFDALAPEAFALTNADDRNGAVMLQNSRARHLTYALRGNADYRARVVEDRIDGMLLQIDGCEVLTRFVGRFNASNLLAVYGAARQLGIDRDDALRYLSMLTPVAGRMQTFSNPERDVTAVVDYAHTPDALQNVLQTIREVIGPHRGIITVTGAGGDRDRGKRPLMAAEAAKYSSVVILTSDNPRHEDPADIIAEMAEGIPADYAGELMRIIDRRTAIERAIAMATRGDVVLVAGKGHEDYQIIGDTRSHFDDREIVAATLRSQ